LSRSVRLMTCTKSCRCPAGAQDFESNRLTKHDADNVVVVVIALFDFAFSLISACYWKERQ